jgi:hypothetical protein
MIFVGADWVEDHYDICVMDETGDVEIRRSMTESGLGLDQPADEEGQQAVL